MSRRRASQLFAVGMITGLAVVSYLAFHPALPFTKGYRVTAIMSSSNQLRGGAPVRIAGVDVGKVIEIGRGPASTTAVTMEIEDHGLPLHRDATVRVRPRVFLEGGFYVELTAGSPSAPELADEGVIPLPQTSRPVQLHQLLTVFSKPLRAGVRESFGEIATGLSGGGADGLREAVSNLAPALRDIAIVAEASRGLRPHDVSELVAAASRVTAALDRDRPALAQLITSARATADALAADDQALAATLRELDGVLRAAPSSLRALDGALPVAVRVARGSASAVKAAPAALAEAADFIAELGTLVAPGARERTVAGLRTTFLDLPTLVVRMAELFPTVKPQSDCLDTHIIPVLNEEVPDGALSSGRPAWQDFAHSMVGLASATQNFDANGYATRYLFGGGKEGFSTETLPGIGPLVGNADGPLQSRPIPLAEAPPIRTDVPCPSQPVPTLETPAGPAR